jgi:hypothetical protein
MQPTLWWHHRESIRYYKSKVIPLLESWEYRAKNLSWSSSLLLRQEEEEAFDPSCQQDTAASKLDTTDELLKKLFVDHQGPQALCNRKIHEDF